MYYLFARAVLQVVIVQLSAVLVKMSRKHVAAVPRFQVGLGGLQSVPIYNLSLWGGCEKVKVQCVSNQHKALFMQGLSVSNIKHPRHASCSRCLMLQAGGLVSASRVLHVLTMAVQKLPMSS